MMRKACLAVALALAACYPPPAVPEPDRIMLEPLLPTPLLDANTAACTALRMAGDAAAASGRLGRAARTPEGYYAGYSRYRYWWSEDYEASYDAAQAAARMANARAAALKAAARVSAHPESAADYAELAMAHATAFSAADLRKDHTRRSAETTLREMARSQPDLEAMYQQEFERRYGTDACTPAGTRAQERAAPERTPGVPVLDTEPLPLLPSPLLDRGRSSCAADIVSERAATEWRLAWMRQVGADSSAAAPPAAPAALADWRAARALADLASLHAAVFALATAPSGQEANGNLESRLRKMARQDPGLEKAYQDAFAPAYSGPACVRR